MSTGPEPLCYFELKKVSLTDSLMLFMFDFDSFSKKHNWISSEIPQLNCLSDKQWFQEWSTRSSTFLVGFYSFELKTILSGRRCAIFCRCQIIELFLKSSISHKDAKRRSSSRTVQNCVIMPSGHVLHGCLWDDEEWKHLLWQDMLTVRSSSVSGVYNYRKSRPGSKW